MKTNKKRAIYFFISVLLFSSGLIYAAAAKNVKSNKNIETKKISEKKDKKKSKTASASLPDQGQSNLPQKAVSAAALTSESVANSEVPGYPLHKNITTTFFWIGEKAGKDNKNISNLPSAWDEDWVKHFGGIDDPKKRNGFHPAGFTPKENPFYFALPYNDFDENGKPKNDAVALAMWTNGKKLSGEKSMCKNQWIRIMHNGKSAYAQWEDVGPFKEDDTNYVCGANEPKSKTNDGAGLDVSPAVRDYLSLEDIDKTDWQFVKAENVPEGPWKKIITTSQINWK